MSQLGQEVMNHLAELAEAWRTGALRSNDGLHKDGERSNRNWDLMYRMRTGFDPPDAPSSPGKIAELEKRIERLRSRLAAVVDFRSHLYYERIIREQCYITDPIYVAHLDVALAQFKKEEQFYERRQAEEAGATN